MEFSKKYDEKTFNIVTNIDSLFIDLYGRTISMNDFFIEFGKSFDLSFLKIDKIKEDDIKQVFGQFVKHQLKKFQRKFKMTSTKITEISYYYRTVVKNIQNSDKESRYKLIIELIGDLIFDSDGLNCKINDTPKDNKEKIQYYLVDKAKSFIEKNEINEKTIHDFIKANHLLFLINDKFHFNCLKFFLMVNDFVREKYESFSNYLDYELNFYYLYYKYSKKNNSNDFMDKILSKIDKNNYINFSPNEIFINDDYLSILLSNLESLIENNKKFKIKIDDKLINNPTLLKIFNLKKIDKEKIKKFFKYNVIQENYLNFKNNSNGNFTALVDKLDYDEDEDKLHVFNIFFLIACGLCDKIEKDSLQIFNANNNVINLFKKYGNILLEKINSIISNIKKNNNNDFNNDEILGFGKVFNTFYVLYSNLNDYKYKEEKLKFDLADTLIQKNNNSKPMLEIKFKLDKSEVDSNFSKKSEESKNNMNKEQIYHEKINADSLEEECKTYIFEKIKDLIKENEDKIQLIEIYKILLGMNFYVPLIDEHNNLKFIATTKQLNNINPEFPEYGYQEFDCIFRILDNEDIMMNDSNNNYLPFVKCYEIKINSQKYNNQMEYNVTMENDIQFLIKKNSLVIVENKLKFPTQKEKVVEYIKIMLKKLNFILKLIKNTTNDLYLYNNIQFLLIYDDIIINKDEITKMISVEQIKSILSSIPFTENAIFSVEIIYISQTVNIYNISKAFDEIDKLKKELKEVKNILAEHGWLKKQKK